MAALNIGDVAPDFTLKDSDNEPVSLSDYRGKNVVILFYPMAFSGVCTKELHNVTAAADRFAAEGAEVLGISIDHRYALAAWKAEGGYKARLLADFHPKGAVASAYGVYLDDFGIANRTTFVIDKNGKVAQKIESAIPESPDPEAMLAALAACPV